jgi:hypothetical protein
MRPQSKPFIVEIKNSKSSKVSAPRTIWGDHGFSAFAEAQGSRIRIGERSEGSPLANASRSRQTSSREMGHEAG